jgi:plasmid stability protein
MATVTIRNLAPIVKERLRVRAAKHGHSMQAEVRDILGEAVGAERDSEVNLAEAIRRRFATFGGVEDLTVHPPVPVREPPTVGGRAVP